MADPYETLGVERTASQEEIRKAYRRLAKKLHPDLNPGNAAAEARFKEASSAYSLLSDAEKRRRFDAGEIDESGAEQQRQRYYRDYAGAGAGADDAYANPSGFADFAETDDILAELFRRQAEQARRAPGADLYFRLAIDFLDAVNGATRRLTLPQGGSIDVTIPPGVQDGQILRLRGKGAPSRGEGKPGDALVEISIRPHRHFTRDGDDIHLELPISLKEAVLGARVRVPTPSGSVVLTIPKGSNNGSVLRLKGKGARRRAGGQGDEFIRLKVVLPSGPEPELESFLAGWTPQRDDDPRRDMQP
ncbi:DnaJ C-terminal domain-containing protein [Oceanibacterium hippocampi]|uniref:Curved DNA-binding protein n=1 Tax=Oceanibacterium hippocampi TaxID=745714 RepID=A0A1Y5THZ7_9PROT|nr:J domain-containing protein [Oceanibacterium hippocampi]SLN64098.1 Curved DNA-binding protein [Oceanibacterium hippocampi]